MKLIFIVLKEVTTTLNVHICNFTAVLFCICDFPSLLVPLPDNLTRFSSIPPARCWNNAWKHSGMSSVHSFPNSLHIMFLPFSNTWSMIQQLGIGSQLTKISFSMFSLSQRTVHLQVLDLQLFQLLVFHCSVYVDSYVDSLWAVHQHK